MGNTIKCFNCQEKALHETYVSSINICDSDDCWIEFVQTHALEDRITDEEHEKWGTPNN